MIAGGSKHICGLLRLRCQRRTFQVLGFGGAAEQALDRLRCFALCSLCAMRDAVSAMHNWPARTLIREHLVPVVTLGVSVAPFADEANHHVFLLVAPSSASC